MSLYLLLMGAQGSGKGTQAGLIREKYGIPHVSTGDLFRAMRTRQDELARKIQQIMAEGRLVTDDDTNAVVQDRLEQPDAQDGVIFDGYPRTIPQAEWLADYLKRRGAKLNAAIYMEIDAYVGFKRAFGRVIAPDGSTHNIFYNADGIEWAFVNDPAGVYPPRLDARLKATGEPLTQRADDASAHAVIKRLDTYLETTRPLIEYYRSLNVLYTVDADQAIEVVWAQMQSVIERAKG